VSPEREDGRSLLVDDVAEMVKMLHEVPKYRMCVVIGGWSVVGLELLDELNLIGSKPSEGAGVDESLEFRDVSAQRESGKMFAAGGAEGSRHASLSVKERLTRRCQQQSHESLRGVLKTFEARRVVIVDDGINAPAAVVVDIHGRAE
jgi:hypothetical protein